MGNPLRFILTPGQARDITQAGALIADLPADHVLGDKGYDAKPLREAIESQDAVPVIPPRATSLQVPCDDALYCERNLLKRFFLKIKHFRRIATRYEQTPRAFMSILCLVSAFIWTNECQRALGGLWPSFQRKTCQLKCCPANLVIGVIAGTGLSRRGAPL